ncbi:MAG: hypothetical protein R2710_13490 [Acidimicrobiales bacterium]
MRPSQEKQRHSAVPVPARRTRPVHYRLTKTEAELQAEAQAKRAERIAVLQRDDDDYTDFLYSMLGTAVFFFLVQIVASVMIANYLGVAVSIKVWAKVLPYIELRGGLTEFIKVTTYSTAATVLLGTVRSMATLAFWRKNIQVVDGRATALLMSGLLLAYQYIRHLMNPPVIDTWIYAQTMAGVVAATVIYLGFRPTGHQSAPAESPARPTRVERALSPTQATEQGKRIPR